MFFISNRAFRRLKDIDDSFSEICLKINMPVNRAFQGKMRKVSFYF